MATEALVAAVRPIQIAVALALLSLCASAGTARASSRPVQGIYEYCAPAANPDGCAGRLEQIAAGGFRVVLNYAAFDAGAAALQRYVETARRLGLQLIWPMKDRSWWGRGSLARAYPRLARDCRCAGSAALLRYLVGLVKGSDATWGYYVADEQSPRDAAPVAAFSRRLRALDPRHPRLAVAAGEDAVARLLAPYAPAADILGADSYPVGTGQPLERVGTIGRAVRAVARARHRQSAMVLQAFNWSRYPDAGMWRAPRWPTRAEMRAMRDIAVRTADPALVLWYSYFDIRQADDAAGRWRDLIWSATGATGSR